MADARKIIIDTDPGQDDAVAIMLALASPEIEVAGITAVAGNVRLALTQKNARKVCELAGRPDTPVFAGADQPMKGSLVTAEYVHGKTGLDGPDLPEPKMELQDQHAVDFIIETLMGEAPGTITLCPLGPLTNIALAMEKEPRIVSRIREIVLMGGGFFEGGNVTPAAEFNIYVDPLAAEIVFRSGAPITMMSFSERFDEAKYGTDGGPLHDPCVIAWLIRPELFSGRDCNVVIETQSELTLGMTVVDWWGVTKREKNAHVVRDVNADGFFALLTERLAALP
jgi:purine nucleosidase